MQSAPDDLSMLAYVNSRENVRRKLAQLMQHPGPRGLPPDGEAMDPAVEGPHDLVLRSARVLTPDGFRALEVGVRGGVVAELAPLGAGLGGLQVMQLRADETLIPGLVDAHVHVNEPGRTEWEGFETATRSAAAGGVTTIIDMPLNSIPSTVTPEALELKRILAWNSAHVDVGFWGGAVPGNLTMLEELHREGVVGFKCFTLPSGVDEFPALDKTQLRAHLALLSDLGSLMIVHAEDAECIADAGERTCTDGSSGAAYEDFLASRPDKAELLAIEDLIDALDETGGAAHLLHLSSARALPLLAQARAGGTDLSVETCPHYLALSAEEIPDRATSFKCCPPIRNRHNQDALWDGLLEGTIDYIASDHSPSTPAMKEQGGGDFQRAWGGVSSLQVQLPVVWTEARRRGIPLERVSHWMSTAPAHRLGLTSKGSITIGHDADLVVLAAEEEWTVYPAQLLHRHPISPYAGRTLAGVVRATYLRGRLVTGADPEGRLLRPRPPTTRR